MLKSHLSTFWNFNLNLKKKLKWGVWNLKEVLNQNGTKLLAIRKWEHSNGSEMSWTSVEPKRKSSNREIQCLFQCANFLVPHIPLHSLRLEFLHFSDQTLLILEASFHLKNKSGNVITKNGFTNKIIYIEWVQIDLYKREKNVKKLTRLFNLVVDGTHDQSLTKEPWIFVYQTYLLHDSVYERQVPPEWRLFLYHNWATHWKTSCLNKMVTYQRLSRFGTTISI